MARARAPRPDAPRNPGKEEQFSDDHQWLYRKGKWRAVSRTGPLITVDMDGYVEVVSIPNIDDPTGQHVLRAMRPQDVEEFLRGRRGQRDG